MELTSVTHEILSAILYEAGYDDVDCGALLARYAPGFRFFHTRVKVWPTREGGTSYLAFKYRDDGATYRTIMRGRNQAINAAYCIEFLDYLNNLAPQTFSAAQNINPDKSAPIDRFVVTRKHIDDVLDNISFDGHFETLRRRPLVIFDIVETAFEAKSFIASIDDYFGRATQRAMSTAENMHPEPFKRVVIADVFYPDFCAIKQNITFIFTNEALRNEYLKHNHGSMKILVMPLDKAIPYALKTLYDHKIFICGPKTIYKASKSMV